MNKNITKISEIEIQELFGETARKTANQVCGQGQCLGCFNCGHTNKADYLMNKHSNGTQCPLEKYNVKPDTRTFKELLESEEYNPNIENQMENMFSVCACCEHSNVIEKDGYYELDRTEEDYCEYCLDCPINMALETLQEGMAEASIS